MAGQGCRGSTLEFPGKRALEEGVLESPFQGSKRIKLKSHRKESIRPHESQGTAVPEAHPRMGLGWQRWNVNFRK